VPLPTAADEPRWIVGSLPSAAQRLLAEDFDLKRAPLARACKRGDIEQVKTFLQLGAKVDDARGTPSIARMPALPLR